VIEVGRRFYRTHLWGNAIVLPLWGRVRIEHSRMETLQGSMSSGVLWGACKPLQCNSTCNTPSVCKFPEYSVASIGGLSLQT
jgi:hypothetical protein